MPNPFYPWQRPPRVLHLGAEIYKFWLHNLYCKEMHATKLALTNIYLNNYYIQKSMNFCRREIEKWILWSDLIENLEICLFSMWLQFAKHFINFFLGIGKCCCAKFKVWKLSKLERSSSEIWWDPAVRVFSPDNLLYFRCALLKSKPTPDFND